MPSLSTVEAELLALSVATQEAIWLKDLACDLNIISEEKSIPIFSDSQGAIQLAKNGNYSPKTKHIIPKYNFVKDYIHDGTITLEHIPGEQMVADMLTKAADANIVNRCVKSKG